MKAAQWIAIAVATATLGSGTGAARGEEAHSSFETDQAAVIEALRHQEVIETERVLSHLSYVCTLSVATDRYRVFDVRELVPGAVVPRGLNRVVIVDDHFAVRSAVEYFRSRPLTCAGDRLYFDGDIALANAPDEGNLLIFSVKNGTLAASVGRFDINALPQTLPSGR